jgi:hypothetical protein
MYEFLIELGGDIERAEKGELGWGEVRWWVEPCVAQRGFGEAGDGL